MKSGPDQDRPSPRSTASLAVLAVLCVVMLARILWWPVGRVESPQLPATRAPWSWMAMAGTAMSIAGLVLMLFRGRSRQPSAIVAAGLGFLLFLSTGLLLLRPMVHWDGAGYYAQSVSIAMDGDLDFANQAEAMPSLAYLLNRTESGRIGLPFSFGPSAVWLLWLPVYHHITPLYGHAEDGVSPPYFLLVTLSSALAGVIGVVFTARAISCATHAPPAIAFAATALVFHASPLPVYCWYEGSYSHAYQFATSALALWWAVALWTRGRQEWTVRDAVYTWAVIGLCFLMRWQSVLIGFVFLGLWLVRGQVTWQALLRCAAGALAFVPFWFVQQFIVARTYGMWLGLPQISPGYLDLARPQVLRVLFSTWNGLFVSHPAMLLGAVATMMLALRRKEWRWFVAIVLLWMTAEVYLVSCTIDWWGGGSFGQRRLAGFVPWVAFAIVAWGFSRAEEAAEAKPLRVVPALMLALLVMWNLLYSGAFAYRRIPHSPPDVQQYEHTSAPGPWGQWDYARWTRDVARGGIDFLAGAGKR